MSAPEGLLSREDIERISSSRRWMDSEVPVLAATALDALDRLAEAERKLDNALSGMVKLGEDVQRMRSRAKKAEARADRLARALERIRDFKPDDARALSPAFQHSVFSSEIARAALTEPPT